jgi:hypothetical protein
MTVSTLETNQRYKASGKLPLMLSWATNEQICSMLLNYGFKNVMVTGNGSVRQAEATWGKVTQPVPAQFKEYFTTIEKI